MSKIAILFNPSSNGGKSFKKLKHLETLLSKENINSKIFVSKSLKDFKSLAKKLSKDYPTLGIAGGDSSYTIALDTIIKDGNSNLPDFAFMPTGSSNDIPREFGIFNIKDSVKAIKNNKIIESDLGIINGNNNDIFYFLGQANIGLGVEVNKTVEYIKRSNFPIKKQSILGFYSILKAYREKSAVRELNIILDNKEEIKGDFFISLFSKIKYWASGKNLFPFSKINNGKLNFFALNKVSFLKLLKLNNKVKKQRHLSDNNLIFKTAENLKISSKTPFHLQVDGEIVSYNDKKILFNEIEILTKQRAIKVLNLI